jgi:hypothetical protein
MKTGGSLRLALISVASIAFFFFATTTHITGAFVSLVVEIENKRLSIGVIGAQDHSMKGCDRCNYSF